MKIILDAMGGDNAPEAIVEGAVLAAAEYDCQLILVGDTARLEGILQGRGGGKITLRHASEAVDMEDKGTSAIRGKKDSSLNISLNLLKDGEGDAFVSAGNTGAVLSGGTLIVKRIKGVRRAALSPMLPTKSGGCLLIDCGANTECTPEYLLQFAFLGSVYMEHVCGVKNPRVGLINNGAEENKGTELYKESHALLKAAKETGGLNFIGNVEGRDIPQGVADVLVADGFTGNILLKTYEGVGLFLMSEIKKIFMASLKTKLAALAVKKGMGDFKAMMDYKEVGGAPMLGISKPIIKAHGSSDARAVKSAIRQALAFAKSGYVGHVEAALEKMKAASENA